MKALLLSIKPEYVEKILRGTKKYEFRKRLAKENVRVIYIYSTSPTMKVVASVRIVDRIAAPPDGLWEKTKDNAGISYRDYCEYFRGCQTAYAYKLGAVDVFKEGKQLSDFGITAAPQSFIYIDVE